MQIYKIPRIIFIGLFPYLEIKNPIKEQIFGQAYLYLKVNTNIPTLPEGKTPSTMVDMSPGMSLNYDKTCMFSLTANSYHSAWNTCKERVIS